MEQDLSSASAPNSCKDKTLETTFHMNTINRLLHNITDMTFLVNAAFANSQGKAVMQTGCHVLHELILMPAVDLLLVLLLGFFCCSLCNICLMEGYQSVIGFHCTLFFV